MSVNNLIEVIYWDIREGVRYSRGFRTYDEFLNYTDTVYSEDVYMLKYVNKQPKRMVR